MSTTRQNKVARLIQKDLGEIIQRESPMLFKNAIVTVTIVRISPDLSFARVYVSIFVTASASKNQVLEILRANAKKIRTILGNKVAKQLRIVPEIAFFLDDSLDYAEHIDNLLK